MEPFTLGLVALVLLALVFFQGVNTIVVPDIGKREMGKILNGIASSAYLGQSGLQGVTLYTAVSGTLGPLTIGSDLTAPTFTGYAAVALAGPTSGAIDTNDQWPFTYTLVSFQPTGGWTGSQTVLGYAVIDAASGALLWVQPFTTAFVFTSTASLLQFKPVLETGQL